MMGVAHSPAAQEAMRQHHAQADSKVIGPVRTPDEPRVVFYQLTRKFVDNERSVPQESQDVLYYTLAVGHHSGVIDCFTEGTSCSLAVYEQVVRCFEEGSVARYKLEGVLRSGEIQIDQGHLAELVDPVRKALSRIEREGMGDEAREFLTGLSEALDVMGRAPAVYVMGRRRG